MESRGKRLCRLIHSSLVVNLKSVPVGWRVRQGQGYPSPRLGVNKQASFWVVPEEMIKTLSSFFDGFSGSRSLI